ncbi:MAG: metal-sulfur cluster assembly factor [Nitrospirae bacterium]|nr:metal-sulfur cluster assembly factor [Nitrospirota bacterium]MBI5096382.1 metal-sulfur cluster assembly factor [Nitrospirota bacterium]
MVSEKLILTALKHVLDPEIGVNIVDLGLVYEVKVENGDVYIRMTMTTPGCPLHESISKGAEEAVRQLPGVENVQVDLVWEPAWTPERMSDWARKQLGWK